MPTQYIKRTTTGSPSAGIGRASAAPIYVDIDDSILKMIPGGSGSTTEVQVVDASSAQTLTNKTLTSPVLAGAVTAGTATFTRTGQERIFNGRAKIGATAGWIVAAATNLPYVGTMAAGGNKRNPRVPSV